MWTILSADRAERDRGGGAELVGNSAVKVNAFAPLAMLAAKK